MIEYIPCTCVESVEGLGDVDLYYFVVWWK